MIKGDAASFFDEWSVRRRALRNDVPLPDFNVHTGTVADVLWRRVTCEGGRMMQGRRRVARRKAQPRLSAGSPRSRVSCSSASSESEEDESLAAALAHAKSIAQRDTLVHKIQHLVTYHWKELANPPRAAQSPQKAAQVGRGLEKGSRSRTNVAFSSSATSPTGGGNPHKGLASPSRSGSSAGKRASLRGAAAGARPTGQMSGPAFEVLLNKCKEVYGLKKAAGCLRTEVQFQMMRRSFAKEAANILPHRRGEVRRELAIARSGAEETHEFQATRGLQQKKKLPDPLFSKESAAQRVRGKECPATLPKGSPQSPMGRTTDIARHKHSNLELDEKILNTTAAQFHSDAAAEEPRSPSSPFHKTQWARKQIHHRQRVHQMRVQQAPEIAKSSLPELQRATSEQPAGDIASVVYNQNGTDQFDLGRFLGNDDWRVRQRQQTKAVGGSRMGRTQSEPTTLPTMTSPTSPKSSHGPTDVLAARSRTEVKSLKRTKSESSMPQAGRLGNRRGSRPAGELPAARMPVPARLPPLSKTGVSLSFPFVLPVGDPEKTLHKARMATEAEDTEAWEKTNNLALMRYIRVCRMTGVVPKPNVLSMASAYKINSAGSMLVDSDLCAMASMIRELDFLDEVDLTSNSLLSDDTLVKFLKKLYGMPACDTLQSLSLRDCKSAGRGVAETMVSLLSHSNGLRRLTHLDLSGIQLYCGCQKQFCEAIRDHPALKSLHLARTGIGHHPGTQRCVTDLLGPPSLETLDLGWNCFTADVLAPLGFNVAAHGHLKTLLLTNCASTGCEADGEVAINCLFENLRHDTTLTVLDVSMNRINPKSALVLEDALSSHRRLRQLQVAHNPLGIAGLRSCLRLLSHEASGLLQFDARDCGVIAGEVRGELSFSATDPSGKYVLDLEKPSQRSCLRMLYKACVRLGITPASAFKNLEYTPCSEASPVRKKAKVHDCQPYRHPSGPNESGVWEVPVNGTLSLMFSIDSFLEKLKVQDHDVAVDAARTASIAAPVPAPLRYIKQHMRMVRLRPSFHKVAPLLAQFRSTRDAEEQMLMLHALSCDFLLDMAFIEQLCCDKHFIETVLTRLLQYCVLDSPVATYMALTKTDSVGQLVRVCTVCEAMLELNVENPTGHYVLDLFEPTHYAVAEVLSLLDRWEVALAKRRGTVDISMYGNWTFIRNCFHQGMHVRSIPDFRLPHYDRLEFDFVALRRVPTSGMAAALSHARWRSLLVILCSSSMSSQDKVRVLRRASGQLHLNSLQLRELLGVCGQDTMRIEVLILLFNRLVDPQNSKVVRARMGDSHEWDKVRTRLGRLITYPFYQPEQSRHELNLEVYEDRLAATIALQTAARERAENIRDYRHVFPDGTEFFFERGVPKSWENMEGLPAVGRFSFSYMCAPEDRHMTLRAESARRYGFSTHRGAISLMWWTTLSDVPSAVLTLLYNILRDFKDVYTAFHVIDGPGGNGVLSLKEMKEAVVELNWDNMAHDESMVIEVFRYLDPDKSGEISIDEWGALHQGWKELMLTILEFLEYLDRTFSGDFDRAYDDMDADGSDSIEFSEWAEALALIGFYGPNAPIFHFLASCENGEEEPSISRTAWQKLQGIWGQRAELRATLLQEDRCCQ